MLRFDTSFDEMQVEAPRSEVLVRTKSGNEQGNSACAWHEKYRRDNWGEKHLSGVKKRRTQFRLFFFEKTRPNYIEATTTTYTPCLSALLQSSLS